MNYFRQIMIILVFVALGEMTAAVIPLPIAGSIYGMIYLLLGLIFGFVKLADVENVADFFMLILPVLFIVPAVGILNIFDIVKSIWPWVIIILVAAYLASMATTGWIAQWLIKRRKK